MSTWSSPAPATNTYRSGSAESWAADAADTAASAPITTKTTRIPRIALVREGARERPLGEEDAETAALDRPAAQLPADALGQVVRARPADVAAPVALTGVHVLAFRADDDSARTTRQAFHPQLLHARNVGTRRGPADPSFQGGPEGLPAWSSPSNTWAGPSHHGWRRSRCSQRSRPRPCRP